jgi:hypothetical protein
MEDYTMIDKLEPEMDIKSNNKQRMSIESVKQQVAYEGSNDRWDQMGSRDNKKNYTRDTSNYVENMEYFETDGMKTKESSLSFIEVNIVLLCVLCLALHPSRFLLRYLGYFKSFDYIVLSVIILVVHFILMRI